MQIMPISWLQEDIEAVSCVVERVKDRTFFNGTAFERPAEGESLPVLHLGRVGTSAMFVGDIVAPEDVFSPNLYRITYLDTNNNYKPIGFMYWDIMAEPEAVIGKLESGRWHIFNGRWIYISDRDPENARMD